MKKKVSFYVDETLLKKAIEHKDLEEVERIILAADRNSLDLNRIFSSGRTLLHLAVINGIDPFLIRRFILLGADINAETADSLTPLHFAFINSLVEDEGDEYNYETILLLLEHGAKINLIKKSFLDVYRKLIEEFCKHLGFSSLDELILYLDSAQVDGYNIQLLSSNSNILDIVDEGISSTFGSKGEESIYNSVINFINQYPIVCKSEFHINDINEFLNKLERGEVSRDLLNLAANLLSANINVYYLNLQIIQQFEPISSDSERIEINLLYNSDLDRYHFIYQLNDNHFSNLNNQVLNSEFIEEEWNEEEEGGVITFNSEEYYLEQLRYPNISSFYTSPVVSDDEDSYSGLTTIGEVPGCAGNFH